MKVLLAIDSSPHSQRLLQEAAARPWPAETVFCVANAVEVAFFVELPTLADELKRQSHQLLARAVNTLAASGLTAISRVLTGAPKKAVPTFAAEWEADLIMAGSHGCSAVARFLLGSVAHGILHIAPCPVEIVRFPSPDVCPSSHPMKILLATDGSECSLAAATSLASRPWPAGTVFRVLCVEDLVVGDTPLATYTPSSIYPASLLEELCADARGRANLAIEESGALLKPAGFDVLRTRPSPGDPRAGILDAAYDWRADMIVLGSHGRRGVDRLLLGSVAESVAVHASCSVEVIRCKPHR